MGTIGFGAGVRPVGAGRVKPQRRVFETSPAVPGGDVRSMRKVGGFNSYSTVGFRAIPPIDRNPAPADPESEAESESAVERELAAAGAE